GTNYTIDSSFSIGSGQSLTLAGSWAPASGMTVTATNATLGLGQTSALGSVTVTGSGLQLLGHYTTPQLTGFLGHNTLVLDDGGQLDNTGKTITLNATTGSLRLSGGALVGGTVTASGGAKVVADSSSTSTLDGVTLNSDLDLTASGAAVTVKDGLTLNGSA